MKQTFLIARGISVKKTSSISNKGVKTNTFGLDYRHKNRISVAALVVLLSAVVSGCESSQLLDLSDPGLASPENTTVTAADGQNAAGEATGGENLAPHEPAANNSSGSEAFPSLSNQPEKPRKTLSVEEKDREIREIEDSSKSLVRQREDNLEKRKPAPVRAKRPASGGIFGLGWLVSGGSNQTPGTRKGGLTPPEKLRLSRNKAANPGLNNSGDKVALAEPDLSAVNTGLRTKPIIPSVPEKKRVAPKVEAATKTASRGIESQSLADVANRPTAQRPIMVFFSSGARSLTKKQQKSLDRIARFRNNDGMNVYVLGFAQVVPEGNKAANIESQDLAISRANTVANSLRKRGFSDDQVVVQIIDEIQGKGKKTNATLRRVDVYFENSQLAEQSEISTPEKEREKPAFGFLKSRPFETPEIEN